MKQGTHSRPAFTDQDGLSEAPHALQTSGDKRAGAARRDLPRGSRTKEPCQEAVMAQVHSSPALPCKPEDPTKTREEDALEERDPVAPSDPAVGRKKQASKQAPLANYNKPWQESAPRFGKNIPRPVSILRQIRHAGRRNE